MSEITETMLAEWECSSAQQYGRFFNWIELRNLAAEVRRLRSSLASAKQWQREVADGLGYLNRPEGQGGYEVAEPRVIVESFRAVRGVEWRDGWIAGREAAARLVEAPATYLGAAERIRSLSVPAVRAAEQCAREVEDRARGTAQCECGNETTSLGPDLPGYERRHCAKCRAYFMACGRTTETGTRERAKCGGTDCYAEGGEWIHPAESLGCRARAALTVSRGPDLTSRCSDCGVIMAVAVKTGTRCLSCADKARGCYNALGFCTAHRQSIVTCRETPAAFRPGLDRCTDPLAFVATPSPGSETPRGSVAATPAYAYTGQAGNPYAPASPPPSETPRGVADFLPTRCPDVGPVDRATGNRVRCVLDAGHPGEHDDGVMRWSETPRGAEAATGDDTGWGSAPSPWCSERRAYRTCEMFRDRPDGCSGCERNTMRPAPAPGSDEADARGMDHE